MEALIRALSERKVKWLSCLTLCDCVDVAYQAPLSMGFSRQGYWSRLPFPSAEYVVEVEYFLVFLFIPFEWTKKRGSSLAYFPHTSSFREEKGILRLGTQRNHLSWILPGFYL